MLNIFEDDIDIEVYLDRENGFGYDAGIDSRGRLWDQVELFCGNQHCKTNIVFQNSRDIDQIIEFIQHVKRAREKLFKELFVKMQFLNVDNCQ